MPERTTLEAIQREFSRHKKLAERALDQVDDDAFFAELGAEDNHLAIQVKHLAGNLRSRWRDFLTTDGEKPDRDRDSEFVIGEADRRDALMKAWETGWALLFAALEPLSDDDLDRTVSIRNEELTVLQAALRQVTHVAYHVGQIVLLAKHRVGGGWQSLSVPRGQSAEFNRNPARYL